MHSDLAKEISAAILSRDVTSVRDILQSTRFVPVSRMSHRGRVTQTSQCDLGHALCQAAELGDVEIVKELLKYKADLLYSEPWGRRPIHCAALGPSTEILKLIKRSGSPLSLQDDTGASALHIAVERQNREMVAFLVNEGPTVTKMKTYINEETPLHVACRIGDHVIVQMILKRCMNPNMKTLDKRTPLMYAVERHHSSVVQALCEAGVNLNIGNRDGNTALHLAVDNHIPSIDILLQHGADPTITNTQGRAPLHVVASHNLNLEVYLQKAELLIEYGAEIDVRDANGQTALHTAALTGNYPTARLLLTLGAQVNAQDELTGGTPLHLAISQITNDVIQLLVDNGADINAADNATGKTPLHRILESRSPEKYHYMVQLVERGARINSVNGRGYTPLDCSVFHSILGGFNHECILRLVQAGAHLRQLAQPKRNILHKSPLCWLTWHGCLPLARFLVECGWDLRHENWIRLRGRNRAMIEFLTYIWTLVKEPRSLRLLCRTTIREYMLGVSGDRDIVPLVNGSPMPPYLKRYINLDMEVEACRLDLEAEGRK